MASSRQRFVNCKECNCMSGPFCFLLPDELAYINKNRVEITYKKGEILCKQGSFASHVIYIKSGLVKLYTENNHNDLVLSLESMGYFVGLPSLFGENVFHYSVLAFEETSACLLDINAFRELTGKNAKFASGLLQMINEETIRSYERLNCLTQKQLSGRLADLLICLAVRIYKRKKFSVPFSRKDMADIMVMSNESLSRVIKDFKSEGIIHVDGNDFEILDLESLIRISKVA